MRTGKLLFATAAAAVLAMPAAAAPDRQAEANAAFVEYPKESLENGEQGAVYYKVKIDGRGKPKRCEVTQSSGHRRLDMATCAMLLENARFTPNRDSRGRARSSVHEGRVVWKIG